ncbi:MAG TPA: hypothetical protein VHB25_04195 [Gemmatimonadaceae bacterium]|nr:hypothetical protein [Gemmatimonadaceae bacterium]
MPAQLQPSATSVCRLCKVATARIHFTENLREIDVSCESCGRFRVEIPGYDIDLDALTGAQRLQLIGVIKSKRAAGEASPLVTNEDLKGVLGME